MKYTHVWFSINVQLNPIMPKISPWQNMRHHQHQRRLITPIWTTKDDYHKTLLHACVHTYCIYPNVGQEFFHNSSYKKIGAILWLHTSYICSVPAFQKTEECERLVILHAGLSYIWVHTASKKIPAVWNSILYWNIYSYNQK